MADKDKAPKQPRWWGEFTIGYGSGQAHGFILTGDIGGIAYEAMSHVSFLLAALAQKRVVLLYDRAGGIRFADELIKLPLPWSSANTMRAKAKAWLEAGSLSSDSPPQRGGVSGFLNAQMGARQEDDPFADLGGRPVAALTLIERLMNIVRSQKPQRDQSSDPGLTVVLRYADLLCPPANKGIMSPEGLTILAKLLDWGSDLTLGGTPIFLMSARLEDLHEDLRSRASGYLSVQVELPTLEERLEYLSWYQTQRDQAKKPIRFQDITLEEFARLSAGLNLRHLEDIMLLGARAGGITRALVKERKDAIIKSEYSEIAQMLDPLPGGFTDVGGMDRVIAWMRSQIMAPISEARSGDAVKGVLLAGPPGTGKTYLVRALAQEIAFNAVLLKASNILGGIVGESEGKLKKFFAFARSLAPVLIFIDELDQSDFAQRGNNSGNPVAANLFNELLTFLGDETLLGKVIVLAATNRPDLIDPAVLRPGRLEEIVPILLPDEEAREDMIRAQAQTQGANLTREVIGFAAEKTPDYSAADLARLVKKARLRAGGASITKETLADVIAATRINTRINRYYTLRALEACRDTELLPPDYREWLARESQADREREAEELTPTAFMPTPRGERSL